MKLKTLTGLGGKLVEVFTTRVQPEAKLIFAGIIVPVATFGVLVALIVSIITVGIKNKQGYGELDIPWMKWGFMFFGLIVGTTVGLWGWGLINW